MTLRLHAFAEGETPARALAAALGAPFGLVRVHAFPDGEVLPVVPEPADTVVVFRSLDRPNGKLVELLLAAEAWRRLGARRLVLVAPYLAYMRQDTAFQPGQAISQTAVGRLLGGLFDRVVTVNPHLHRTASLETVFGGIPASSLSAGALIGRWLASAGLAHAALVIGPDVESGPLARDVAAALGADCATFRKVRHGDRSVELAAPEGVGFPGRSVVVVDDICSTGSTLAGAVEKAKALGAAEVQVAVVHALFDEAVQDRLSAAGASRIVSTDCVRHPTNAVTVTPLLAEALAMEVAQ